MKPVLHSLLASGLLAASLSLAAPVQAADARPQPAAGAAFSTDLALRDGAPAVISEYTAARRHRRHVRHRYYRPRYVYRTYYYRPYRAYYGPYAPWGYARQYGPAYPYGTVRPYGFYGPGYYDHGYYGYYRPVSVFPFFFW